MSEPSISEPAAPADAERTPSSRGDGGNLGDRRTFRIGAVIVLAVVAVILGWLLLRDTGSKSSTGPRGATPDDIKSLAAEVGHPVYWLGPQNGFTYEWRKNDDGSIVIRYLPSGVDAGTKQQYAAVATYPFEGAYAALMRVSQDEGGTGVNIPGGGISVPAQGHPESVHVAYPGAQYQVEVFDPTPGVAARVVKQGHLLEVGRAAPAQPSRGASGSGAVGVGAPEAASVASLKALGRSAGHPVYWLGARSGTRPELTQREDGSIVIRYLPAGTEVGSLTPELSIATYPFPGALAALRSLTEKDDDLTAVELPNGGLAVIDPSVPHNAHVAFPGEDYQIEVFAPSPAQVRRLVRTGRIVPLG